MNQATPERAGLPRVHILATGGTIAGRSDPAMARRYTAGQVGVEQLLAAVPQIASLAQISGEQIASIGSQDMNDEVWLALARRINALLADPAIDGVVVTHGTDTLEETAYFLNLTVRSAKPVVLVGAMRPSDAISADGPANLFNAVAVAADPAAAGRGVMAVMGETVFDARDVTKLATSGVDAFDAPNHGPLGRVVAGKPAFHRVVSTLHTAASEFDVSALEALPRVGVIYNHAGASDLPARAFIEAGYAGIVSAGVGNGNLFRGNLALMETARRRGIAVVRSARVPVGATTDSEIDDARYGFVAAGTLNPQKARVLLQLALTRSRDVNQIAAVFARY